MQRLVLQSSGAKSRKVGWTREGVGTGEGGVSLSYMDRV